MSDAVHHSGMPLEDALSSSDPTTRIMARLAVCPAAASMADWINAEINRPDFCLASLLLALARFQIQTHASILHHFVEPPAFESTATMFHKLIDIEYVAHANRARDNGEGSE